MGWEIEDWRSCTFLFDGCEEKGVNKAEAIKKDMKSRLRSLCGFRKLFSEYIYVGSVQCVGSRTANATWHLTAAQRFTTASEYVEALNYRKKRPCDTTVGETGAKRTPWENNVVRTLIISYIVITCYPKIQILRFITRRKKKLFGAVKIFPFL